MIDIENMSDKKLLREQYKDTGNLELRKSLHEKYSVNKVGFQRWMFEQYPFRAGLWEYFRSLTVDGYLHVPKEYGMFVAGK